MSDCLSFNHVASAAMLDARPMRECSQVIRRSPGGENAVVLSGFRLAYPLDHCGTLCWRDGFKTGRRTPSGMDANQKKLIVMSRSSVRRTEARREKGTRP